MNFRLEFGESRSGSFLWVLRLCKKLPSFKETVEEGLKIYSIEFTEKQLRGMRPILGRMANWSKATLFVDDTMVYIHEILDALQRQDVQTHNTLMDLKLRGHHESVEIVDTEAVDESLKERIKESMRGPRKR